ncbi:threonine/homoserine/homoserine lactone efflux protein [Oxalobacteraceae bacterium GrIS 2.11]
MNIDTWWLFATATFFISAAPGPNMLLILSQSVRFNIHSAVWGALGCLTALLIMQTASAAGLGVLLRGAPAVFDVLRWGGAIYLTYLGIRIFFAPVSAQPDLDETVAVAQPAALSLFKTGFMTAASNPKALLFAAAFFPQFLNPALPQLPQFGILLGTFVVIETSWYLVYAIGGQKLAVYLKRPSVLKVFNRVTGTAFVAFAAIMASMKA